MNPGIEPLLLAATALLALVAVAFIGASLLPDFLLHQRSSSPPRGSRAIVKDGAAQSQPSRSIYRED